MTAMAARGIRAAVIRQVGGPFLLEDATLRPPLRDEVLVRIVATGMCHADILARDQTLPAPHPIVLGHEGAGIVVEKGEDVRGLEVDDHVVLSFAFCGHCKQCMSGYQCYCDVTFAMNWTGADLEGNRAITDAQGRSIGDHFFGQSSFATYAVVNQRNAIRVSKSAPLELLGPLGCGVQTGAGAVMNSLKLEAGSSFACFGAGAVGMSALLAAEARGAARTIAVDIVDSRLELAKELGVTHVINARSSNALEEIRDLTGGGVDYALDTTGSPQVVAQGIEALNLRGTIGLVAGDLGGKAEFEVIRLFAGGRTIRGIAEGDSVARAFIPQLADLFMAGKFAFDKMIRFYEFDDINQAAKDSLDGHTVKPVIRISAV